MPYPVKVVTNVRIPMPDGVTLAADLFVPEVPPGTRVPAIIEYTPYHKVNNTAYGPRATRYPYFASQGYVFVNVDVRGTGDSGGASTCFTSDEETADGVEVVKWCAKQPWCDGSVGMIGISYTAGVCYDAARRAPDELKAIIVCQMCSDWYSGLNAPGGQPRVFVWENYAPLMAAYNNAPPTPERVGDEFDRLWKERLEGGVPWALGYLRNFTDGPFWESKILRGDAGKIRAATMILGGWCDWYCDDFLRVFAQLRCAKRAIIGPWTHNYPENAWPLPRINDRYECLRWFDKYLKGIDTDSARPVDREKPLSVFVRDFTAPAPLRREDAGRFVALDAWPVRSAREQLFWFAEGARLSAAPEAGTTRTNDMIHFRSDAGVAAGRYVIGQMLPGWGMADDQRIDEGASLIHSTEPLAQSVTILGEPRLRVRVSSDQPIAFLSAKLCDVAPDGTSVLVTTNMLNLTRLGSHTKPAALTPGKIYEVDLSLRAAAYRFAKGHRIRLMLATSDVLNAWPVATPFTITIHREGGAEPIVSLPVVADADALPSPKYESSEFMPPTPPEQMNLPAFSVTRDLIQQSLTCSYTTRSGVGVNRSTYTVSLREPANAHVVSEYEYPLERPGKSILARSRCVTRSDATSMHHETHVVISINGRPFWEKRWSESVGRALW